MEDIAKVSARLEDTYTARITAGEKFILADEPLSKGGKDLGFNPMELLASSLASCSIITLKMYAQRKGWDLGDIHIEVIVKRDEEQKIELEKQIAFPESLTEEQKKTLLIVSERCPVHKALSRGILTQTLLV